MCIRDRTIAAASTPLLEIRALARTARTGETTGPAGATGLLETMGTLEATGPVETTVEMYPQVP